MTDSQQMHTEDHGEDWDGIYDAEQVWSGNPNDALVAVMARQLSDLPVGSALDVGCGEGADAVWLAGRGWQVTAVDVAQAALARGENAAQQAGAEVSQRLQWVCSDIGAAGLAEMSFNLVIAFYPALRKDSKTDACQLLPALVAPGGALLFVHHAEVDREKALAHGFDPDDYVGADDLVAVLGEDWDVECGESTRNVSEGRGAHHSRDVVVIARRHA